jgi:hypothetical protein
MLFIREKQNESYGWYDEVSIAAKNSILRPDSLQGSQLCWMAGKEGA